MDPIDSLIAGYRNFRRGSYQENAERYRLLAARQQRPKAMIVCCCDSRADPALILDADPGELFVVRNVANLIPHYQPDGQYHGTSAALEFGLTGLEIGDVIVMGHAHCGGIAALLDAENGRAPQGEFIGAWMSLVEEVATDVKARTPHGSREDLLRGMEHEAVLRSMAMLRTFPFVREREAAGKLRIHGWFFGIATGELSIYDDRLDRFVNVPDIEASPKA